MARRDEHMFDGGCSVAIIPARSGSRGLRDKNVLELCGKPLMVYTIEAVLESGCFNRVVVSTDSKMYGSIAQGAGAEVSYRDERLSNSTATSFMVIEDFFSREPAPPEVFGLFQPTSPFRNAGHVKNAFELYLRNRSLFDFVVSVAKSEHPRSLVHPLDKNGALGEFADDYSGYRRQNEADYSPNGALFIGSPAAYLERGHFFGPRTLAYVMSKEDSIDIDDELDFALAEARMGKVTKGTSSSCQLG